VSRDNGNGISAWSTCAEQVAANLLRRYGLTGIWELQPLVAKTHREGDELAARSILDIADAAERIWARWLKDIPDLIA
jgi:hypothetical protein